MDNAHICQLHYKITWVHHERPMSTNQYMLSLKFWIKSPTSSNVGRDTSINVLNGTLSIVPLVCLLHVKCLLPASDSQVNEWKDILKISR